MLGDQLPVLETARLILRPYTPADAKRVQQICGDWDVASTTLALPHPYPDGAAEEWISTHAAAFAAGNEVTLAITLKPDGLVIGSVSISINATHRRGGLGYLVAKEHWDQGYCTEATGAIVEYGFGRLELNRIQAMHFPRNPASGRVMQKLGMTREGTLRQYVLNRDVYEDLVLYALLRSDFQARSLAR